MKNIYLFLFYMFLSINVLSQIPDMDKRGVIFSGSYHGGDVDKVDVTNGNLSFHIPLFSLPQKGNLKLSYSLVYNSNPFRGDFLCAPSYDDQGNPGAPYCTPTTIDSGPIGPGLVMDQGLQLDYTFSQPASGGPCSLATGCVDGDSFGRTYYLHEADGASHSILSEPSNTHQTLYTADGAGYIIHVNGSDLSTISDSCPVGQTSYSSNAYLVTPDGITHDYSGTAPCQSSSPFWVFNKIRDRMGNEMKTYPVEIGGDTSGFWSYSNFAVQDSLNRTIPQLDQPSSQNASLCPNIGVPGQPVSSAATWQVPGPNGGTSTYIFCYTDITYNTRGPEALECPNGYGNACTYYGAAGPATVLQSLVLPNGTYWGFVYDSAGPFDGNYAQDFHSLPTSRATVTKLIYPTGGSISYTYSSVSSCGQWDGIVFDYNQVATRLPSGNTHGWSYQYTSTSTTVTDPYGNDEVHTLVDYSTPCPSRVETAVDRYAGLSTASSPTLLQSHHSTFANEVNVVGQNGSYGINLEPTQITDQLAGGVTVIKSYDYPSLNANVTDFNCTGASTGNPFDGTCGSGASYNMLFAHPQRTVTVDPSGLTTTEFTQYEWQSSASPSGALQANDLMLPTHICLEEGDVSSCNDETQAASFTKYDYYSNGTQKTSSIWDNKRSLFYTTTNTYTTSGRVKTTQDPRGSVTTFDYDSNELFPVKITKPTTGTTTHISYYSYDQNTGNILSYTDENGSAAGDAAHTTDAVYDNVGRIVDLQGPPISGVRPHTERCYTDVGGTICSKTSAPYSIYTLVHADPSPNQTSHDELDGFGRDIRYVSSGNEIIDTTYDDLSRIASVSNPHFSISSSSDGITSFQYDALNRKTKVINPDDTSLSSSYLEWIYTGDTTDTYDELGNHKQLLNNGRGQLIQVVEPDPQSNTPSLITSYSYDSLGNLIDVVQNGGTGDAARHRTFTYDSLSHLIQAHNPESGWVCYGTIPNRGVPDGTNCTSGYDANGNLTGKTDARGISTFYGYDALNRLTGKTYSDLTPPVLYNYDEPNVSWIPQALTNTRGKLSSAYVGGGTVYSRYAYSYDPVGRTRLKYMTQPNSTGDGLASNSGGVNDEYDLAGNTTFTSTGDGVYLYISRDSAGHVTGVTAGKHTTGNLDGVSSYTVFSNAQYNPLGQLSSRLQGNGLTEARLYDSRGRLQTMSQSTDTATHYSTIVQYQANGNVASDNDSANGNWTYQYDHLNRLTQGTNSTGLTLNWSYDAFGNRISQSASGTGSAPQVTFNVDTNNRLQASTGIVYDASGNVIHDNLGTDYTYDAEGRISTSGPSGETKRLYDADGLLIYQNGPSGLMTIIRNIQGLPSVNISPTSYAERAYIDGELIGTWNNSSFSWVGSDWLGTKRYESKGLGDGSTATLYGTGSTYTSLPFGDALSSIGPDLIHFTGKERDAESGLDNFGARYYGSSMGRFMSPDWATHPTAVPYATLSNPQSLNLYAYVGNNPLSHVDPDGHIDCTGKNAAGVGCQYILKWNADHGISNDAKKSDAPGVPVKLPNGNSVSDPHSKTGLLMSPTADLSDVAAAGKKASGDWTKIGLDVDLGKAVGTGGSFDYQRMGPQSDVITGGFQQLPQFRDVSNFNVGLYAQQAGMSLEDTLKIAGNFASHFSSNYSPNSPYGLAPQTAEFIRAGWQAGASGAFNH